MEKIKIRRPVVAGQFYPDSPGELKAQIESYIDKKAAKTDAIACMLPHAGYMCSGRVAGATVSQLKVKDKVILLGNNHTGRGTPFSIMTQGIWQTPLGEVTIDEKLAQGFLASSEYLKDDDTAHLGEHSLEVELPFLQYFKSDFKIVPLAVAAASSKELKKVGEAIAAVILRLNIRESCLLVASSDMTHYEPQKQAEFKDQQAIQAILELDEEKLAEKVREFDISMCGYSPVAVMLVAAKSLGAKRARLVKYETSGDVLGDKTSVVGYAGIIIY